MKCPLKVENLCRWKFMCLQSWGCLTWSYWISNKIKTQPLQCSVFKKFPFHLKLIAMKVKVQACSPVESLPAEFQAEAKTPSSWGALLQGRTAAAGRCKCSWKDFCLEPKNIRLSLQFSGCRAISRGFPNAWACSHLLQIRPAACQVKISPP